METEIIELIEAKGPLTGAEISAFMENDELMLWRACRHSKVVSVRSLSRRYLRLDRQIKGFARLSPSILREFLTYSVIGLRNRPSALDRKVETTLTHIREISRIKLEMARSVVLSLVSQLESPVPVNEMVCVMIAGDIVYGMAHDVPRPERHTGKRVKGSDIDLVAVADDGFPEELARRLDEAVYEEKQRLLMSPFIREEIDYIVKPLARVREQTRFDTFKRMVACKILHEGRLLMGSRALFDTIKALLQEQGVTERLRQLEGRARVFRRQAEIYLLSEEPQKIREGALHYFYPAEESEEFE